MRYEDTSGSVSGSATPGAHDDADTLSTGSNGPATGNVITGAGTTTGKAGADTPANGHVVDTTVIAGRALMRGRRVEGEQEAISQVRERAARLTG